MINIFIKYCRKLCFEINIDNKGMFLIGIYLIKILYLKIRVWGLLLCSLIICQYQVEMLEKNGIYFYF